MFNLTKNKLIIFSAIVLLILAGLFYWYYQQGSFSKSILKLEVLGPDNIQMGEEFEYTIRYKNNSDFTLQEPKLTFEYPEYTINEGGKARISQDLEDIYPGDEQFVKLKARLLGKEGDLKIARVTLSYRPKNLKARYESDTTLTTKIETVPITLDLDLPSKVERGKEIEFSINYFSNVEYSLADLKVNVEYPDKFDFAQADPKPLDKNQWTIDKLDKAQGGRIKIMGDLNTDTGQKVQFKANIGIWKDGEFILLKETTKEVETIEPLLYISQQINGSPNYVASPGEKLHYEIYFRNIGNTPFENLFLINNLNSDIFDLSTLRVVAGQVQADDSMIIWDWKQVPALRSLDSQEEGKVEFDINLKCCWQPETTDFNNTFAVNKVNISQISQEFQTRVNSKLLIMQRGAYQDPTLVNSGPIPPVVGQPTTYTIIWQAKNFYNEVRNVKVRATLPLGVTLTGRISPDTDISKFSFDSNSREIVWNVSDSMAPGTGILTPPANIMFQVSLTPTYSQKGRIIPIINQAIITGDDQSTGMNIQSTIPAIDTTLPDDTGVSNHSGIVQ